jgi:NAD(P)-dependent dehydrogenase (short-subunit alcohol dehydrogenase family)
VGKPRDERSPVTSLKDQVVLVTGASGGKGGAMITPFRNTRAWAGRFTTMHHATH